jgi:MoaA/NifB/PqqE/SkfB family radical SAM enzyme
MATVTAIKTALAIRLSEATNRTLVLPLVIFYPTSRCNSRCLSCDWWRSSGAGDLTLGEIERVADALPGLGTRVVVFSGGEPLLRPEVFQAAQLFQQRGVTLHLLTSGVLLDRSAEGVARHFAKVVISLDGSTEASYQAVRGVAALTTVERGVARLRRIAPHIAISARATLHRLNFRELPDLIAHAKAMALDRISFLAADLSSRAFGRMRTATTDGLALSCREIDEFEHLVEETIARYGDEFDSGFVAESRDRLRQLPRYYAALCGLTSFPPVECNAPWMSVVVEADGAVRPCFFHDVIGNIRDEPLDAIVMQRLPAFRARLDMRRDPVCTRCVCSMRANWRSAPWR